MELTNYRDLSRLGTDVGAGFQFEFHCDHCSRTWKSPFKPYRIGQLSGLLNKFAYFFGDSRSMGRTSGHLAEAGSGRARRNALEAAMLEAVQRYTVCPKCEHSVCEDCWSPRAKSCQRCADEAAARPAATASATASAGGGGTSCPNCRAALSGGRFCAECGFDMASTHKGCPSCGTMCLRSARYCTDCGHSF